MHNNSVAIKISYALSQNKSSFLLYLEQALALLLEDPKRLRLGWVIYEEPGIMIGLRELEGASSD